jgi:Mg-chelatase subunit ChlD
VEADSPIRRQSDRPRRQDPARGLKPLRRKPKTLTEEPELRDASQGGGAGMVLGLPPGGRRDQAGRSPSQRGGGGPAVTEEQGTLVAVTEAAVAPDPETLRRAREIAARLAVPRPRTDRTARRGAGDVASVPYRGGSDDIDLDRTLEQLTEHPVPEDEDIIVRERVTTTRSVVLLVDLSGSMRGERVRTAAAAVGALAAELSRDNLAVIAFWSDAAVLSHLGQHVPPERLLESMLRIPARGLTNVAFPLQVARRELARVPARDARVLLLSDCVHNAGPDPRPFAARLPRLDVLLDTTGEQDPELARDLARLGRGRLRLVRTYRDVAPALTEFFAS